MNQRDVSTHGSQEGSANRPRLWLLAASVFCVGAMVHIALAQTTVPANAGPEGAEESPTTVPATEIVASSQPADDLMPMRAPLLRESSHLVEARGTMKRDVATNWWKLQVDPQEAGFAVFDDGRPLPPYELILLPSTTLSEMQRVFESTSNGDRTVMFEVTGQVLVFRGRNYALISHAGRLVGDAPKPDPAPESQPATAPSTQPASSQPHEESIDDIKRGLERSLERTPEHISASETSTARATGSASQDATPARLGFSVDAATTSSLSDSQDSQRTIREGTAVQNRRGKILRDSSGAWLFIFDADATLPEDADDGEANSGQDPPMRLLPCLLLEKIEDFAKRNPSTSPVLMSGEVFLYEGRNYLLPTVFRIPQERTKIAP